MQARDPAAVVEDRWRARAVGAWEVSRTLLHPNFELAWHVPQDVWFFAGSSTGISAYLDKMAVFNAQFEQLRYQPALLGIDGDQVRGKVEFRIRHRKTGYIIDGACRQIARVRGGRVVALDEYHDVERIKAFMKMVSCAAMV
jgi:ketosteroid isomerase-like protein